jgi:hypothetical protein
VAESTQVFRGHGELIDHVLVGHLLMTKPIQVTTAIAGPGRLRSITKNARRARQARLGPRCGGAQLRPAHLVAATGG